MHEESLRHNYIEYLAFPTQDHLAFHVRHLYTLVWSYFVVSLCGSNTIVNLHSKSIDNKTGRLNSIEAIPYQI